MRTLKNMNPHSAERDMPGDRSEGSGVATSPSIAAGGKPANLDDSTSLSSYARFGAMIAVSMTAMFALTYANSYALDHVMWSETRFYMIFYMGATMAVIMLAFMLHMYRNMKVNLAIVAGAVVIFAGSLWLLRSQTTVQDTSYMRGMIPHHSIAILTSERAEIEDARVRELADEIIAAQEREIAEMKWLIDDIETNGPVTDPEAAEARSVPDFSTDS